MNLSKQERYCYAYVSIAMVFLLVFGFIYSGKTALGDDGVNPYRIFESEFRQEYLDFMWEAELKGYQIICQDIDIEFSSHKNEYFYVSYRIE